MTAHQPLSKQQTNEVEYLWEAFLNDDSLKQQLTSRYIYEHLFLSHIYFSDFQKATPNSPIQFFALVRSATPPGLPVKRIATRRPYDDPKVERVYYRHALIQQPLWIKHTNPMPLMAKS